MSLSPPQEAMTVRQLQTITDHLICGLLSNETVLASTRDGMIIVLEGLMLIVGDHIAHFDKERQELDAFRTDYERKLGLDDDNG